MKYKVGQKVRVKKGLMPEGRYEGCFYPEGMCERWEGKTVTISKAYTEGGRDTYHIVEGGWTWVNSFFEPVTLTADEAFQSLLNGSISDETYTETIKKINTNN